MRIPESDFPFYDINIMWANWLVVVRAFIQILTFRMICICRGKRFEGLNVHESNLVMQIVFFPMVNKCKWEKARERKKKLWDRHKCMIVKVCVVKLSKRFIGKKKMVNENLWFHSLSFDAINQATKKKKNSNRAERNGRPEWMKKMERMMWIYFDGLHRNIQACL